jgi:hypothetical protein
MAQKWYNLISRTDNSTTLKNHWGDNWKISKLSQTETGLNERKI